MNLTAVRKRAWKTRRAKYGERGHDSSYSRVSGGCRNCGDMRAMLIRLHAEGVLSEGQVARATGLERVAVRAAVDACGSGAASRSARPHRTVGAGNAGKARPKTNPQPPSRSKP